MTQPQQNTPHKDQNVPTDKNKNPDQQRDANKSNPDSTKQKGDNCGC